MGFNPESINLVGDYTPGMYNGNAVLLFSAMPTNNIYYEPEQSVQGNWSVARGKVVFPGGNKTGFPPNWFTVTEKTSDITGLAMAEIGFVYTLYQASTSATPRNAVTQAWSNNYPIEIDIEWPSPGLSAKQTIIPIKQE